MLPKDIFLKLIKEYPIEDILTGLGHAIFEYIFSNEIEDTFYERFYYETHLNKLMKLIGFSKVPLVWLDKLGKDNKNG